MASSFVPVKGVTAACVASCPMIDVCTTLLFNVAVSPAAQQNNSASS